MFESRALRNETELKFLLLFFHFLLTFQENLCNFWESLFDCHISKLGFFDFVSSHLLSSSRGAAIVLETGTGWLDHIELETLHGVVISKDQRSTEWSVRSINGAHLEFHGDSVGKNRSWASDTEHTLVLVGLLSSSLDDVSTIWNDSVDNSSGMNVNRIESLISTCEHHLVDDNLFSSHNDSIFADNSENGAKNDQNER